MSCRHAAPLTTTHTTIIAETAELAENSLSADAVKKPLTAETAETAEKKTPRILGVLCGKTALFFTPLVRNGRHPPRAQRFEKPASRLEIELRVLRLDAQEEAVAARQREAGHVEDRVIGHRQAVERQHAEDGRQGRSENRAFEGDGDKRRPTVQRPSADVDRIRDRRCPV